MTSRRKFLQSSFFGSAAMLVGKKQVRNDVSYPVIKNNPVVVSTWETGLEANKGAWKVLGTGGRALDAVEEGVKVTETSINCCVGLGANPDRDGFVTLDASIMDENMNCGSVAFLERIKHPISVARRVMEKTPHVMLVGAGAQQFAVSEGFPLEEQKLSDDAREAYEKYLKDSKYKPVINIENTKSHGPYIAPEYETGEFNHDTIGMIAMDSNGNLSGSCTTSGMAFKMRGRVGDSPIIGAGLYVDNEAGAAVATGTGEEVIRICGSHMVVEWMRQGLSPKEACKRAVARIVKIKGEKITKSLQVAFIAINKKGEVGSFAIQPGFDYAVKSKKEEQLHKGESWFK